MNHVSLSSDLASSSLARFLGGDVTSQFAAIIDHEELMVMAKTLAPNLPSDLLGEVVNELWLSLLENPPIFDRARGDARVYLRLCMRNALKTVSASYAAPGTRRRRHGARSRGRPVMVVEQRYVFDSRQVRNAADPSAFERIEARALASQVLAAAPPLVKEALVQIHFAGATILDVARRLGVSRFKLSREVARFTELPAAA